MTLLDATVPQTAGVALLCGVAFHLSIRPYEIDYQAWTLVFVYQAVLAAFLSGYVFVGHFGILASLGRTFVVATSFNVGLTASILIYRAFLHPLHRFPGPFAAKLSRFYTTFKVAKTLQGNIETQKLHAQYGDVVRVGPREISINRPAAVPLIYGPQTRCTKSPWYSQVSDDVTKISINSTRAVDLHKRRKRAWEKALSFRALSVYEPRIKPKVDLLLSRIDATAGAPINMTELAMFFGFDVMGEVGFSKDFHMLESGVEHPAIRGLHDNMAAVGIGGTVPWLLSMASKIPGATGTYERFTSWCAQEFNAKREVMEHEKAVNKDQDPRDVLSWLLKMKDENDESAPPGEGAFHEDSRLMIIAGSDTTSVALANSLYYLTKYPAVYRKLQHLVRETFPGGDSEWTYEKAKTIAYLDHIAQETLRLKPSIPAGLSRLTPPGGLQIDEISIPGDTVVSVPTWTIHRDERYWGSDALEFRPERWEGLSPEKAPWIPFTRGQYVCPGRNLALMELRMVLSRIALKYDLAFPAGAAIEQFDQEAKDTFTLNVPALPLILTRTEI